MDPITHAASGALLAMALPKKPHTHWFIPLAALGAALPDIDVIFSPAPVDFLLLHRGISHSLVAAPILGVLYALCMFPLWRKTTEAHWSFAKVWFLATGLMLLHIWLDCVTTYGTMIFLPFSEYRVRLNGVFIVDICLMIPMLLALYYGYKGYRQKNDTLCKKWATLGLIWVFVYPGTCVALRIMHQHTAEQRLLTQGLKEQELRNIAVLPDAFAPLYWRLIYETEQPFVATKKDVQENVSLPHNLHGFHFVDAAQSVFHQGLDWRGMPTTPSIAYPALSVSLSQSLVRSSRSAQAFLDFSLMPVEERSVIDTGEEYAIYDLRFASMLPMVQSLMQLRNGDMPTFLFWGRREYEAWTAVRMQFGASGKDSGWQKPEPPRKSTWWQWLVGL